MVYCDNQGVVDGWKKGRSRNTPTNTTFRRIHNLLVFPSCRSQNMLPAQTTQLTDHLMAGIPLTCSYSHRSPYPRRSTTSSSILTIPSAAHSASNIDFTCLSTLPTSRSQTACSPNKLPCRGTKTGGTCHTEIVCPYPLNLTIALSDLRPHCAAMDRLGKWLPNPDSLSILGPPATLELQERVKAVTLQGWAKSTRATYGAGLLIYHVFCDSREVPK
jgi:hypothetical protein